MSFLWLREEVQEQRPLTCLLRTVRNIPAIGIPCCLMNAVCESVVVPWLLKQARNRLRDLAKGWGRQTYYNSIPGKMTVIIRSIDVAVFQSSAGKKTWLKFYYLFAWQKKTTLFNVHLICEKEGRWVHHVNESHCLKHLQSGNYSC